MTKFFLQTSDPSAPSVLNGLAPFIPFAWAGVTGDLWTDGLVARDLWAKLRAAGVNDRPLCLFSVMGWAINNPGNAAWNDWDQITRLWNGNGVDIGGPLHILRVMVDAMKNGYPDWPQEERAPTFVHCMHEGSYWARYLPKTHGVWTEIVPNLKPSLNPDIEPDASRLYRRAVNGETRESRRVLERMGWGGVKFTRENIHGGWKGVPLNPTDDLRSWSKTMYEPPRVDEEVAWIKRSPHHVPHLCAARSDFIPLLEAMAKTGTTHCNVFCGNSKQLDDANADGLDSLAAAVRTVCGDQ